MKIIKRSGKEDFFDRKKIEAAISKANITVMEAEQLSDTEIAEIAAELFDEDNPYWTGYVQKQR